MTKTPTTTKQPTYIIVLLILAAEAVFILPFVLQRIFRTTFLESFNISQLELGSCFSIYGIVALFSYLFGGPLADRFKPNVLMSIALILTGLGGLYLSSYPNVYYLHILYGFWGFTTIFLFWAPMIKATRIWGGKNKQGLAFGFLDGGRGLVAALFGSVGVLIFSLFITKDIELTSIEERRIAFKEVITYTSYAVIIVGLIVFFLLKLNFEDSEKSEKNAKLITINNFKLVMQYKAVWLLMIIILCAYYGYKMTNLFTQYAEQVVHYNKIEAAKVGTYLLYMRPVIGTFIGFLADRTKASLWIIIGFILMAITSLVFATGIVDDSINLLFILSIGLMAIGVYSARVLYFATLEEAKIPLAVTGTAVGFISVVGYTPDIFTGLINGYFLDAFNEVVGHQIVFGIMFLFAIVGCIASYKLYQHSKSNTKQINSLDAS
ncbi:MFS transporter [Winogradskyella immobilis]|uniref:MFS transporter n=1 Tax=Winogradskyella immobilis TaxID=2816852 RepID=A0ABS8ELZ8_9FLAO|nr:MFS transporter [Winogradskyella immobilis]MCC1484183.1 MFS transporter [Winogradskyella immobilis]MCG0016275.1 MFS transporter [Winogradskyella immobilis]